MVASDSAPSDSLPSAFRASDEDRDDAIRMLRDGSVDGRISNETFLRRVDRALRARGLGELAELLSDLPPGRGEAAEASPPAGWPARFTAWLRGVRPPLRFRVTARQGQPGRPQDGVHHRPVPRLRPSARGHDGVVAPRRTAP